LNCNRIIGVEKIKSGEKVTSHSHMYCSTIINY
jgi:hypothetical protein